MQRLVTEVRRFRSEQGLKPAQRVPARLRGEELTQHEEAVRFLLRLAPPEDSFSATASVSVEGVTVELDLSGVIDVAAERRRLERDLVAAEKELTQVTAKLDNDQFVAKAPDHVVARMRARRAAAQADIDRIVGQLSALPPT